MSAGLVPGARRAAGRTLRLVAAGPMLLGSVVLAQLAAAISGACRRIEGVPARPAPRVRPQVRFGGPTLLETRRAARVLFAQGFDTVDVAALLGESEADVTRWVCRRGGDVRAELAS